ncbi:metallophosphoesterase [Solirubrobacter phytolaccae]|uniref:Metallophosphoesterase n=1 Tax=Solirubrobacter phytolaccae TaxID=1404360 RepID=A0A9X3NHK6_9ACTN|nr:metallophosphoesterase [Solirubrobacter phytolaccae]MDA0181302.1 metallophosphoesterase [Solirubrobacter phytolaccae]
MAVAEGRVPTWARRDLKSRLITYARRALSLMLVVVATCAGGYLALVGYQQTAELSVGEIRMSVSPGHRGALDVYVPLVDWGARFEAIDAPVRLRVDLQTVNRRVATSLAEGKPLDVEQVRKDAEGALRTYLMRLIGLTIAAASALGLLVAFAIRSRVPRLRWTAPTAILVAIGIGVAMIFTIPPRGEIADPQYYAHGPDIPRALEAVAAAQRTPGALNQELDAQLVGLARLVIEPGRRQSLTGQPTITVASDLHNNTVALGVLERATGDGPLFFVGDLTDRGSPLETTLVRRIAHIGDPFVFVSGNHDSDYLKHELADEGAVVLTQNGRLKRDGTFGPVINEIAGLKVAGYDDPFERRSADSFRDRFDNNPQPGMQEAFLEWLRPLLGKVDVVMVHEGALLGTALQVLKDDPPERPIVFLIGHTHQTALEQHPGVTVINGGSIGAGGTGNLGESTALSLARFVFTVRPSFQPLAADLVSIDPGTGNSSARRVILEPESTR